MIDSSIRFGVEIETVGISRQALAYAVQTVVGGTAGPSGAESWAVYAADGRKWAIVPDGSLTDRYRSGEVVTPILTYADLPTLQEVVRALRRAGAGVDRSTGLHIHCSSPKLDAPAVGRMAKIWAKQERLLEQAIGVSAARLGHYCKPVSDEFLQRLDRERPENVEQLKLTWYGYPKGFVDRYCPTRYTAINLASYFYRGTVEVRSFAFRSGKLHAGEVKAYVQLVLCLATKAITAKAASSKHRAYSTASARYDMRVFLVTGLGMIGDEFATARELLTRHLPGNAAWKNGRPNRLAAPAADTAVQAA